MTRWILRGAGIAVLVASACPAMAQTGFEIKLPTGLFRSCNDNEVCIENMTISDPPKLRMAVRADVVESNLGAVSWNTRRRDSDIHDEYAYLMGRLTPNKQGGAIYFAVRPSGSQSTREVFYIDDGVAIFRVPIQAPNLTWGAVDKIVSNNGRYVTVQQGDGNFVTYDTALGPVGDRNSAVWSAWSGVIAHRSFMGTMGCVVSLGIACGPKRP